MTPRHEDIYPIGAHRSATVHLLMRDWEQRRSCVLMRPESITQDTRVVVITIPRYLPVQMHGPMSYTDAFNQFLPGDGCDVVRIMVEEVPF